MTVHVLLDLEGSLTNVKHFNQSLNNETCEDPQNNSIQASHKQGPWSWIS